MNYKIKPGMTLVEMIIAIGIFMIGMTVFTLLFIKNWKSNSFIVEEGETSFAASRAIDSLVDKLRRVRQGDNGSYPIEFADENNLIIYVDIDHDNTTERVHYFLDENSRKLKEGITEPLQGSPIVYPSEDQIVNDLAGFVFNDDENPVFTYFSQDYPASHDSLSVPVNANELQDIRLIKISLWINIKINNAPENVKLESMAELRNINNYVN